MKSIVNVGRIDYSSKIGDRSSIEVSSFPVGLAGFADIEKKQRAEYKEL
jgi:hypothetical protein